MLTTMVFPISLFILGLCMIIGAFVMFFWALGNFWSDFLWEYFILSVMVVFAGLVLVLVAWRLTHHRH